MFLSEYPGKSHNFTNLIYMTSHFSTLYCLVKIIKLSTNKTIDGKLLCKILILLNKLFVKGSFMGQCFLKTHKVKIKKH